jgi:hypothetical protein
MKTIYVKLAEIFLHHEYRKLNQSIDFQLIPTSDCQRTMTRLGWLMRNIPNGYGIFASTASVKPSELQYADVTNIVLRFVIRVENPYFYHFADLERTLRIGKNMLYFNNVKKPVSADEQGFLENHPLFDNPAYNRMPIRLMTTSIYRDTLVVAAHVTQTILTMEVQKNDETGSKLLKTFIFDTPDTDSETKIEYSIDLSTIDGFSEGRYELFKTVNLLVKSTESIFYAPDLNETAPMSLIELWASTGEQPFLKEGLQLPVRYHLHFASKPVLLQYVVENTLTKEAIASDIPQLRHRIKDFGIKNYTRVVEKPDTEVLSGKVLFTAQDTIKWQATMKTPLLTYQNGAEENHPLPMPEPNVAPQRDTTLNQYIVKVFVTY